MQASYLWIQPAKPISFSNGLSKGHHHPHPFTYKECFNYHTATLGGHALDGCGEFMLSPSSISTDPTSLKCAACGCHRNFHRCEPDKDFSIPPPPSSVAAAVEYQPHHRHHPPPPQAAPHPPRSPNSSSPPPISSSYMLLSLSGTNNNNLAFSNHKFSGNINHGSELNLASFRKRRCMNSPTGWVGRCRNATKTIERMSRMDNTCPIRHASYAA